MNRSFAYFGLSFSVSETWRAKHHAFLISFVLDSPSCEEECGPVNLKEKFENSGTNCNILFLSVSSIFRMSCIKMTHTKSSGKYMVEKVDFWGQKVGYYEKSLKTRKYFYLKFWRPGLLMH